jgi:hypothetical protein
MRAADVDDVAEDPGEAATDVALADWVSLIASPDVATAPELLG